jgi:hypothetical protein
VDGVGDPSEVLNRLIGAIDSRSERTRIVP